MFRRPSGVYVARLAVPMRLRPLVGRIELIQSTGSCDEAEAKVIATGALAVWRRALQELERGGSAQLDILQLTTGSPRLQMSGFLPLHEASAVSGIDQEALIRAAGDRRLALFVDPGARPGFIVPVAALDWDAETGGYDVPPGRHMPAEAVRVANPGIVQLSPGDVPLVTGDLVAGKDCELVAFTPLNQPAALYCPMNALAVSRRDLLLRTDQVERLRTALAGSVTREQIDAAKDRSQQATRTTAKEHLHVTDVLGDFMADRARRCAPDQARRIRAACELFAELAGNPEIGSIDREMLRNYRDKLLPQVPANENKIRLKHGTTSVKDSMAKGRGYRLAHDFPWRNRQAHAMADGSLRMAAPGEVDCRRSQPGPGPRGPSDENRAVSKARDLFTRDDLAKIFSASWFQIGHGQLTRAGTYRDFLPYYYWLPVLGLYNGARINELCQLHLSDIRQTASGTWYIDIALDDELTGDSRKRLKTVNSARSVPVHPHLIRLGLLDWRDTLRTQGHARLFPELLHNDRRGHSAAAVKWFSGYLKRLGWPRTGKKVFHSFRHTLASECLNSLDLSEQVTAQISGHARGTSVLTERYRKDVEIDELARDVARLDFGLKEVARFDVEEGVKALKDALRRKRKKVLPAH